jgi:hypothetical protein
MCCLLTPIRLSQQCGLMGSFKSCRVTEPALLLPTVLSRANAAAYAASAAGPPLLATSWLTANCARVSSCC